MEKPTLTPTYDCESKTSIKTIDIYGNPFKLIPRYETGPRHKCMRKQCGQCRVCLHPKPKKYYKLHHIENCNPNTIPDGGYCETVEYGKRGRQIYYMYCPYYI